jgi:hypothetical protein
MSSKMVYKLLSYRSVGDLKSRKRIKPKAKTKAQVNRGFGGMYFDTTADKGQPLLLPEESCLAEDETAMFDFHCPREGFHLFGWGDVNFYNVKAKVYLTTYRVNFFDSHALTGS